MHTWNPTRGQKGLSQSHAELATPAMCSSRAIVYVHVRMPFESSNPPGAGPIFPDLNLDKKGQLE